MIHRVYRFDGDDNVHWARPIDLLLPDVNLPTVSCMTGSRSTAADRRPVYFPREDPVENMETLEKPLLSVKYVVHAVSSGRAQARQNSVTLHHRVEEALLKVLRYGI